VTLFLTPRAPRRALSSNSPSPSPSCCLRLPALCVQGRKGRRHPPGAVVDQDPALPAARRLTRRPVAGRLRLHGAPVALPPGVADQGLGAQETGGLDAEGLLVPAGEEGGGDLKCGGK